MPSRFQTAVVSCSALQPQTNPTVRALNFPGGIVRKIRILIPAGHAGLTGISLGFGGNATVPTGSQAFYSGDNRELHIDYIDNNPGVGWQAFLCNNDLIPHVWEVDFDLEEIGVTNGTATVVPLSPTAILTAGSNGTVGA